MSDALDSGKEIGDRGEADVAFSEAAALGNFSFEGWRIAEVELLTNADLAAGAHQALPFIRIVRDLAGQQNFDPATEKILCCGIVRAQGLGTLSATVAVETRREHPSIVQYQQIVRTQQAGEFSKAAVLPVLTPPTLTLPPGLPMQVQQARC